MNADKKEKLKPENKLKKKDTKESLSLTNRAKRLTPKQIVQTALNKAKAEQLKIEIQHSYGLRSMYWNHTKNYAKFVKDGEDLYVKEQIKKYPIAKFLDFFLEKPYNYSLARRFLKEYIKKDPFTPDTRKKVRAH